MLLEICRIWTDWLEDPSTGLNVRLASVERDPGDPVPTAVGTFAEPTTHQGIALLELPQEFVFPGLLITPPSEAQLEEGIATGLFRAEDFPLAFLWVGNQSNAAVGVREGSYTMRALLRAINALMDPANVASRTRNAILIEGMTRVTFPRPIAPLQQTTVSLAVFAGFQVAETNP